MLTYNCLIVEDEPIAAEVLQGYVEQIPFLSLKGICIDAVYAADALQKEDIDVMFLDIHLPKLKGLDLLRTLKNAPRVIITSAYQEYALQGFDLNVIDYLLKPIEFSRFLAAVNKLKQGGDVKTISTATEKQADPSHLFFNVNKKQVKLYVDEILYIESLREYVKITTPAKSILTKIQIGEMEDMLAKHGFIRIHRSFIVSKKKIEAFSPTDVEINGRQIPIGRNFKELVLANFNPGK